MVSLEYFIHKILRGALWPWDRLSLWKKWVPGLFRCGSKGGRCVGLTLPPFVCRLSWNVAVPPSWNHQVLSRIALPLQRSLVVEWNDENMLQGSTVLHCGVAWIESRDKYTFDKWNRNFLHRCTVHFVETFNQHTN